MVLPWQKICNNFFLDLPKKSGFQTYDDLMKERRQQAKRSVLIQVQSDKSCPRLYEHCAQYGAINKVFHYTTQHTERVPKSKNFLLIE